MTTGKTTKLCFGTFPLAMLVFMIFLVLKLTGVIAWPWLWLWIGALLALVIFLFVMVVVGVLFLVCIRSLLE